MCQEILEAQVSFISIDLIRQQAELYQQALSKTDKKEVAKKFMVSVSDIQDDAILKTDSDLNNVAIIHLPVSSLF